MSCPRSNLLLGTGRLYGVFERSLSVLLNANRSGGKQEIESRPILKRSRIAEVEGLMAHLHPGNLFSTLLDKLVAFCRFTLAGQSLLHKRGLLRSFDPKEGAGMKPLRWATAGKPCAVTPTLGPQGPNGGRSSSEDPHRLAVSLKGHPKLMRGVFELQTPAPGSRRPPSPPVLQGNGELASLRFKGTI